MSEPPDRLALCLQLACIWEATARKAGNVHPGADFADMTHLDFLASAAASAPALARAPSRPLGATIEEAVLARRAVTPVNTNLGIILLLAPLSRAAGGGDLRQAVGRVLAATTIEDTRAAYRAITAAGAGGLGEAPEQDLRDVPTITLREAMALAADRDLIARQYAADFAEVFAAVPALVAFAERGGTAEAGIQGAHLTLLASHPDSLIARKRGVPVAREASDRARRVLEAGWPLTPAGQARFAELDSWLRADGHARNPGTSADLVCAALFVALWEGAVPLRATWPRLT